jgi:hypothetical protein
LDEEQPTEAVSRDQALMSSAAAAADKPLAAPGQIGNGRGDGSRVYNVNSKDSGNTQSYLLRRLARDAPDILERVKAGEFKSARAAAIEAGIIKPVPTVRIVEDLEKVAESLRKHLNSEQLSELLVLLQNARSL